MSEDTTVYVVDSDQAARGSMAAGARSKGVAVRELESGEALFAALPAAPRACVILSADLPSAPAEGWQTRLQQANPSLPVVVVGREDVRAAVRAMQQGAVSYVARPVDAEELSSALDLALQRAGRMQVDHGKPDLRTRFEQLTRSEREVLSRVIDGQPNRRIAAEMDMGLRTVELRRSNIMRKTGAGTLSELIRLAIEANFLNGLPPPPAAGETDTVKSEPSAEDSV